MNGLALRAPDIGVQKWNALLVWQWQIVEIIRATTEDGRWAMAKRCPITRGARCPRRRLRAG
ncbi:MAG: hypothetical protein R2911_22825 [Caldilineaceae bacterium]